MEDRGRRIEDGVEVGGQIMGDGRLLMRWRIEDKMLEWMVWCDVVGRLWRMKDEGSRIEDRG